MVKDSQLSIHGLNYVVDSMPYLATDRKPRSIIFLGMKVAVIGAGAAGLCCARHLNRYPKHFHFQVFEQMLEEIGNQEEFRLDTPVNREVLKVLEELKGSEKSIEELLLTIEGEVVELISTCVSGSVELMKRKSIPKLERTGYPIF